MEKTVIRTENAPAPFQGAPYNQAIRVGDLVFVAGQLGPRAGRRGSRGRRRRADRAGAPQPRGHPRGGRQLAREPRQDERLPPGPRRLRGDERGVRPPRRRPAAGPLDVRGREAPVRRPRRDRGRRTRLRGRCRPRRPRCRPRSAPTSARSGSTPTSSAGRSATSCSGIPHRDEDFLVARRRPGGPAGAARAARPRGGHGGARAARRRAPPPARPGRPRARAGRHRAHAAARRAVDRAGAPRLRDRQRRLDRARGGHGAPRLHDQRDGASGSTTAASSTRSAASTTSSAGELRTVGPTSFEDDPLRLVRALRFVSQLGFDLAPETAGADARGRARASPTSPPSGSAAGSRPTGRASSRSSCSGASRRARSCSRATRASSPQMIPEFAPAIGYSLDSRPAAAAARRAHLRRRPARRRQRRPPRGAARRPAPRPRQARSPTRTHDVDHRRIGRRARRPRSCERLRYPTRVRHHVVRIVADHGFKLDRPLDARDRAPLPRPSTATSSPHDLIATSRPTSPRRAFRAGELERARGAATSWCTQERSQPHRIADLAVTGDDLRAIGFAEGPGLGRVLHELLDDVVDDPARNDRGLAARARRPGAPVNADAVREAYEAVCAEAGRRRDRRRRDEVRRRPEEMGVLADAGIGVVGENRAQDLQRKHELYGDRFRWHFIGALQSNKARVVNELCELVARGRHRLGRAPADGPVAARGEPRRRGVEERRRRGRDRGLPRALPARSAA